MSLTFESHRHVNRCPGIRLGALLVAIAALAYGDPITAQEPPAASFEAAALEDPAVQNPAVQDPAAEAPPAAAPGQARENGAQPPAPTLSFSFRFAPWESVLTKFADVAGLTLDLSEVPEGTFNYHDKGRYTPREALDILNGYLLQRGFILIRRDRFLVCVNLKKGIPANLIPLVTVDQLADYGQNELVSVILTYDHIDAELAERQIAQLQGPQGKVVSLNGTNSLLITDTGGSLRLIKRLLDEGGFKRRGTENGNSNGGLAFQSFALQHHRAEEAERLIRALFGLPDGLAPDAAEYRVRNPAGISITTDARSNRLFVTATIAELASIQEIITAYDVPAASVGHAPQPGATTTRIVPLPNTDVIVIGQALQSLSPRIRVSTTRSTRTAASSESTPERKAVDQPGAGGKAGDAPAAGASQPEQTPQSPDGRGQ